MTDDTVPVQESADPSDNAPKDAQDKNHPEDADLNTIIDRIATRFGAFAVVSILSAPYIQFASGSWLGYRHGMAEVLKHIDAIWLFWGLAAVLYIAITALFLATFAAILSLRSLARRWWERALADVTMLTCFIALFVILGITQIGGEIESDLLRMTRELSYVELCASGDLYFEECDAAVNHALAAQQPPQD